MKMSRRSLGKNALALLGGATFPKTMRSATVESIGFPWAVPSSDSASIPRIVVEDFSKPFDPAYLSNGLIGIRPGSNPLARAQTCVSGFVFISSFLAAGDAALREATKLLRAASRAAIAPLAGKRHQAVQADVLRLEPRPCNPLPISQGSGSAKS